MFQIGLHKKDKALLEKIQSYFGVGGIYKQGPESIKYVVGSRNDLEVIINHFDNYPLITLLLRKKNLQIFYYLNKGTKLLKQINI